MAVGRDAEETKEWDRFWDSGRVEDYLRYRGCFEKAGKPEEKVCNKGNDRRSEKERDRFW